MAKKNSKKSGVRWDKLWRDLDRWVLEHEEDEECKECGNVEFNCPTQEQENKQIEKLVNAEVKRLVRIERAAAKVRR